MFISFSPQHYEQIQNHHRHFLYFLLGGVGLWLCVFGTGRDITPRTSDICRESDSCEPRLYCEASCYCRGMEPTQGEQCCADWHTECLRVQVQLGEQQSSRIFYPAVTPQPVAEYDVYRLCKAIARHETNSCTTGVGATHNNCVGIKRNSTFVRYSDPEESIEDCVRVWTTYYKRMPDLHLARRWSGNDRANAWLQNVLAFYD